MLIDWFTVIAQVINFLILVWLLKRFLYWPILNAIDAREKSIVAKIADADEKEAEAQEQLEEYQQKNKVFDQQRDAHMNEVIEAANTERTQLLDKARQESEDLRGRLEQSLRTEQHSLNEELIRRTTDEVFAISKKILSDLAGTSMEQCITEIFVARLRELNTTEMAELKSVFKSSSQPLVVHTAFELSERQCAAIETLVKEIIGKDTLVDFQVVPKLISGIEISCNGRKIAWSIEDYLGSLAKNVDDVLKKTSASRRTYVEHSTAIKVQGVDDNEH